MPFRYVFVLAGLFFVFSALTPFANGVTSDEESTATATSSSSFAAAMQSADHHEYRLIIHGGAGTILPENMTDEQEAAYRQALEEALRAGHSVLANGGSATDAVIAAIVPMEDSELFNAGRGSVFTSDETVEMDASIMEGKDRDAGAVAGVMHTKNPIKLARLVMDESPHVMLAREGAERFGEDFDIEFVENEYFHTERRLEALRQAQQSTSDAGAHQDDPEAFIGTVGAVALDQDGNLAAATSTGGMTNKKFGRIGDSPIIGAGTYADNRSCAVSSTGHGEFFIRAAIAYDVCAMMRYTGLSLAESANAVIHGTLTDMGATGGLIAMDAKGNVAMPFNTPGMYRGVIDADGSVSVKIFRD